MFFRNKISFALFAFVMVFSFQNCGNLNPSHTHESSATISSLDASAMYQANAFGKTGLRRLNRRELVNSVSDIFEIAPNSTVATNIPEDINGVTHFDNDYESQSISPFIVNSYSFFAETYTAQLIATSNFVQKMAGCVPQRVDDSACLMSFISHAGRLLFRRPLSANEVTFLANTFLPYSTAEGKFITSVEMSLLYFLQHPEFLYRIEAGTLPNQHTEINDFEIATRMSFMIWGSAPDDELLDAAEAGHLKIEALRLAQAQRMLADDRAKANLHSFHAQWLGYSAASLPAALADDLRLESNSLIDRIVFDQKLPWMNLFSEKVTYLTPALAAHYNMASINSPQWISYSGDRGGGILAHGAFLSLGSKFGDTSPTVRGYEIYKRLRCGRLGAIPAGVNVDAPPGNPTDCKPVRYNMRSQPSCVSCHSITDNIGFGLENFDTSGRWRTTEPVNNNCMIDGKGSWGGKPYSGPAELGELIAKDPLVSSCATRELFRYFLGRLENSEDSLTLNALSLQYKQTPQLQDLILAIIKSPAIGFARGE